VAIKAVRPTRASLSKLRAVVESDVAPAEMLNQKMNVETLFGTLYSALTTYEFMKLEAEYRRRKASGRVVADTEARWQEIVRAFQTGFASAGIRGLTETDLKNFVTEFTASRATFDSVVRVANTAVPSGAPVGLTSPRTVTAAFVPTLGKFVDTSVITSAIADLCSQPIKSGSFTKHFSQSISLSVRISYPCGISWSGIKWCTSTVTLAGVSFSIDVNVGYKIDCCGATAWGQGYAQVCATIVGIRVCAGCSATITGVAGVSRTPVTSGCSYGLGINAVLKCTLAGATILNISAPFGWTVTGPCPPVGVCP
jgi:hypothetical protein